ncbi:hypothetical protein TNCV_605041 [Trichonephila clavipes]|nr:hypothetical protein TNCV_605041 [Trichonephila clavipes]
MLFRRPDTIGSTDWYSREEPCEREGKGMAFVSDTERGSGRIQSSRSPPEEETTKGGLIRKAVRKGKGGHCSTKRIERLWARGCLMPHNGRKSGAEEATTETFAMIWCLL